MKTNRLLVLGSIGLALSLGASGATAEGFAAPGPGKWIGTISYVRETSFSIKNSRKMAPPIEGTEDSSTEGRTKYSAVIEIPEEGPSTARVTYLKIIETIVTGRGRISCARFGNAPKPEWRDWIYDRSESSRIEADESATVTHSLSVSDGSMTLSFDIPRLPAQFEGLTQDSISSCGKPSSRSQAFSDKQTLEPEGYTVSQAVNAQDPNSLIGEFSDPQKGISLKWNLRRQAE